MKTYHKYLWQFLLICIGSLSIFNACTVGPDFKSPILPKVTRYTRNNIESQTIANESGKINFVYDKKLEQKWWRLFNSKPLTQLINQAIQHNNNLASLKSTLKQAQQNLHALAGSELPQIGVTGDATALRIAPAVFGIDNVPPNDFVLYNASVNVSYNLDLFGSLKRQVEAMGALVQYQAYQLQGAKLALASNVTTTVFKLALLNEQIKLTKLIIKHEEELLYITKQQLKTGAVSKFDINMQKKSVLNAKTELPVLEKAQEVLLHQLAIYLGKPPATIDMIKFKLSDFKLNFKIPIVVPTKLVRQRPDILASEALLHQASAQIGVATANMYPQLNINASGGPLATQKGLDSISASSWIWSFGPGVSLPIFNGGTLKAQKKAAIHGFKIALANYKQSVIIGIQDVADSLVALKKDNDSLVLYEKYYKKDQENLNIIKQQHKLGSKSYVDLLNVQITNELALIKKLQAKANRLSDTVALLQSIGGLW